MSDRSHAYWHGFFMGAATAGVGYTLALYLFW